MPPLRRLISLGCLALACIALPQPAEAQTGPLTISAPAVSAFEGDDIVFTLTLSRTHDGDLRFFYWTEDLTATANADYVPLDRNSSDYVQIAAGATSVTITVETHQDSDAESDETFRLVVDPVTNLLSNFMVIGTINEPRTVGLRNATESASEGGNIVYTVELSARVNQDVVLGILTSGFGEARSGVDYQVEDGSRTVTIPAGDLSATFEISTNEDFLPEVDESLKNRAKELTDGKGVDVVYDAVGGDEPEIFQANARELEELAAEGKLQPMVSRRYKLDEVPRGMRDMLDRKVLGKVVVDPTL